MLKPDVRQVVGLGVSLPQPACVARPSCSEPGQDGPRSLTGSGSSGRQGSSRAGSTAHEAGHGSALVPREGRKFPKPSSGNVGQQGASPHMQGQRGGGGRRRGVPFRHRSMVLVLAAVLGYGAWRFLGLALDAAAGVEVQVCLAFGGAEGPGFGEPGQDGPRSLTGSGSSGRQGSSRAGSTAHEAGHGSALVHVQAARQGRGRGERPSATC